jgi:hypothetical protein
MRQTNFAHNEYHPQKGTVMKNNRNSKAKTTARQDTCRRGGHEEAREGGFSATYRLPNGVCLADATWADLREAMAWHKREMAETLRAKRRLSAILAKLEAGRATRRDHAEAAELIAKAKNLA